MRPHAVRLPRHATCLRLTHGLQAEWSRQCAVAARTVRSPIPPLLQDAPPPPSPPLADLPAVVQMGRTALHVAAHAGRLEVCEFLLLMGACADTETNVSRGPVIARGGGAAWGRAGGCWVAQCGPLAARVSYAHGAWSYPVRQRQQQQQGRTRGGERVGVAMGPRAHDRFIRHRALPDCGCCAPWNCWVGLQTGETALMNAMEEGHTEVAITIRVRTLPRRTPRTRPSFVALAHDGPSLLCGSRALAWACRGCGVKSSTL